jgi:hypothetical protein
MLHDFRPMRLCKNLHFIQLMIFFGVSFHVVFPHELHSRELLPHVLPAMENPGFWLKKIKNPDRILLTPEQIKEFNEGNLKKSDLRLFRIADLKEVWSREEIVLFLKEDWDIFFKKGEEDVKKHFRNKGLPIQESFWTDLSDNINSESLKEKNKMSFGLVVKTTDIRVFPTEEKVLLASSHREFDRLQHSSLSMGSPVGIYIVSKDGKWVYVQAPFMRGWIRLDDIAVANERGGVSQYEEAKNRIVVTGDSVRVYETPSLRETLFIARMGSSYPLASRVETHRLYYVVKVPIRKIDGQLAFREAYFRKNDDLHIGFLPYTPRQIARQAFKMLHQPYGWGDWQGGRDCSRFIKDIFGTFGILMPRDSEVQAKTGEEILGPKTRSLIEKEKALNSASPLTTLLWLPGHIMLYLGSENGRHYVIHSIWGFRETRQSKVLLEKVGRVAVSDLDLGSSGPHGSLLQRIRSIRSIGPPEVPK